MSSTPPSDMVNGLYVFANQVTPLWNWQLDYNFATLLSQIGTGGGGGGSGNFTVPVTIAPTSGVPLTITGTPNNSGLKVTGAANTTAGEWVAEFHSAPASAGADQNGVLIQAGFGRDSVLTVLNSSSSNPLFNIFGDGSGSLGPYPNQLVWNTAGQFSLTGSATLPGGGGGGVSYLSQLLDVSLSSQTQGQALTWNASISRWTNTTLTTPALSGLTDVSLTALSNGQVLTWSSASNRWVNQAVPPGALAGLTDVALTTLSTGQNLTWNGTRWANAAPSGGALATLSDVTLTSPAAGQFLSYNGSRWVNVAAPSGGGGGGSGAAPFAVSDPVTPANNFFYIPAAGGATVYSPHGSVGQSLLVEGAVTPHTGGPGAVMLVAGGQVTTSNQWLLELWGFNASAGCSNGLWIEAGTNSIDAALLVQNQAATSTFLQINGDGSGLMGAAGATGNRMTWNSSSGFTFTSISATTPAFAIVSPPATTAGIWLWQVGGGGPSGASPGCSNGLRVAAGTNASDSAFMVRNDADNTTFMQIRGDGSGLLSDSAWSTTGVFTYGPSTDPNGTALVTRAPPATVQNIWMFQIGGGASGASAGCSNGLYVGAGTNSADVSLWVQNDAGTTDYLKIKGDGSSAFTGGPDTNVLAVSRTTTNTTTGHWLGTFMSAGTVTAGTSNGIFVQAGSNATDYSLYVEPSSGSAASLTIKGDGSVQVPSILTTATAANAVFDNTNNNNLLRSTSAARFKTQVESLSPERVRGVLRRLRAVSYRSRCVADDPSLTHYGLIAEEVAEVDPNLVTYDADGQPSGVQYERIAMLLLPLMQELLA